MAMPVMSLSGGQKAKLQLAKLLLSEANLLLLDEPTNHLDISSVQWLEDFLRSYKGAVFVISHDRYFLDRITTVSYTHLPSVYFILFTEFANFIQLFHFINKKEQTFQLALFIYSFLSLSIFLSGFPVNK